MKIMGRATGLLVVAVVTLALFLLWMQRGTPHLPAGANFTQTPVAGSSNVPTPPKGRARSTTTTAPGVPPAVASGVPTNQSNRPGTVLVPSTDSNVFTNVRSMIDQRKYAEALAAVDNLLSSRLPPAYEESAILVRARLLTTLDRKGEAVQALSALLDSTTAEPIFREALALYFILCRDTGILAKHLAIREAGIQTAPYNTHLLQVLAGLYEYAQMAQQELRCRENLATKVQDIQNLKRLVELYKAIRVSSATSALERLVVIDAANASAYLLEKARLELGNGDITTARQTTDQLAARPSLDLAARIQIGLLQYAAGDYDKAVLSFESCLRQAIRSVDQDRCVYELARTRLKQNPASAPDLNALQTLATNSQSMSIKISAARLLKQMTDTKE